MAKSLLCFGTTSRFQKMMRRGRTVNDKAGNFVHTAVITEKEIEDTMDYILAERKKNQDAILEQVKEELDERQGTEKHDIGASDRIQPTSDVETS